MGYHADYGPHLLPDDGIVPPVLLHGHTHPLHPRWDRHDRPHRRGYRVPCGPRDDSPQHPGAVCTTVGVSGCAAVTTTAVLGTIPTSTILLTKAVALKALLAKGLLLSELQKRREARQGHGRK